MEQSCQHNPRCIYNATYRVCNSRHVFYMCKQHMLQIRDAFSLFDKAIEIEPMNISINFKPKM